MISKKNINIDICFIDFDGCIYPGISKVDVAYEVSRTVAFSPIKNSDRKYVPDLLITGFRLFKMRLIQKLSRNVSDGDLVTEYVKQMRKIPAEYIDIATKKIVSKISPGCMDTVGFLTNRISVGIISLALLETLSSFNEEIMRRNSTGLSFYYGNQIYLRGNNPVQNVLTSEDKYYLMKKEIEQRECSTPLVIGNDIEDVGMAELARKMGGISIGMNPPKSIQNKFDYVFSSTEWIQTLELLNTFF